MRRLILSILFVVVLFSVPFTYFVFIAESFGVPAGGYDPAYLKHVQLNKIIGKCIIFAEFLVLITIFYKLLRKV